MRQTKGGDNVVDVNKLRGLIVERGKTFEVVANDIGVDRSTFYRRMKNGETFTLGEIERIVNSLNLSNEEAIQIFLAQKSHKCEI